MLSLLLLVLLIVVFIAAGTIDHVCSEVIVASTPQSDLYPGSRLPCGSSRIACAAAPVRPLSNSWLPTAEYSRPISLKTSTVGLIVKEGRNQRAGANAVPQPIQ